jgi:hypothetical protein
MKILILLSLFIVCALGSVYIFPNDTRLVYTGRVDTSLDDVYQYDWASVRVSINFQGSTSVSVILHDIPSTSSYWGFSIYYNVVIDGNITNIINSTAKGGPTYILAQNLTTGPHTLQFIRRNEPSFGVTKFAGFSFDDGTSFSTPSRPSRRIEFIGDSITCGWGDEGIYPCTDEAWTENNQRTYASMTGDAVGAEYFIESWSGQGMSRYAHCPNVTCTTMPVFFKRTLGEFATSPNWDFSWTPQAVVINLGTNDYGSQPYPPINIFTQIYLDFVNEEIIAHYGNITIFVACVNEGIQCTSPQAAYNVLKAAGIDAHWVSFGGLVEFPQDIGCDGHPGLTGHMKMAKALIPVVQQVMQWY